MKKLYRAIPSETGEIILFWISEIKTAADEGLPSTFEYKEPRNSTSFDKNAHGELSGSMLDRRGLPNICNRLLSRCDQTNDMY